MLRHVLVVIVCVIASSEGFSRGGQSQRRSAPPPRQAPQPKPKPATRPTGVKAYENKENRFTFRAPAAWTEGQDAASLYSFTINAPDQPNPAMFQIRAVEPDAAVADVDAAVEWLKKGFTDHNKEV